MTATMIDLNNEQHAYFIGFAQGDGHHREGTRNRGSLSFELSIRDIDILHKFASLFPISSSLTQRTRDTQFKSEYTSCTLRFFDLAFREELISAGVPCGPKSNIIAPPALPQLHRRGYIRGLIDADGSLGITSDGKPFVSICTASEHIKEYFNAYITAVCGHPSQLSRNARDGVYNIMLMNIRAVMLVNDLYFTDCSISLDRKLEEARKVAEWVRPSNLRAESRPRRGSSGEDAYVLCHTAVEASGHLLRTVKSVTMRRIRLLNPGKYDSLTKLHS